MDNVTFCQSCGMPLNKEEVKGTEKNGLKTDEYCKYCYENGTFKNPDMNLEDMKKNVQNQMKKNATARKRDTKSSKHSARIKTLAKLTKLTKSMLWKILYLEQTAPIERL